MINTKYMPTQKSMAEVMERHALEEHKSISHFLKSSGIHNSTWSNLKSEDLPSMKTLERFCEYVKISPVVLFAEALGLDKVEYLVFAQEALGLSDALWELIENYEYLSEAHRRVVNEATVEDLKTLHLWQNASPAIRKTVQALLNGTRTLAGPNGGVHA